MRRAPGCSLHRRPVRFDPDTRTYIHTDPPTVITDMGRSNTGKHKGICYVEFATEEEAARLVAKSGFELSGRRVATAFAKEARPKEKVSARKQQKW